MPVFNIYDSFEKRSRRGLPGALRSRRKRRVIAGEQRRNGFITGLRIMAVLTVLQKVIETR